MLCSILELAAVQVLNWVSVIYASKAIIKETKIRKQACCCYYYKEPSDPLKLMFVFLCCVLKVPSFITDSSIRKKDFKPCHYTTVLLCIKNEKFSSTGFDSF